MKKQANLSCAMIVQQLEPEFWIGWDEKIIEDAQDGNLKPLLEELVKRFDKGGCIVSEAYAIIHDKDTLSVWNQEEIRENRSSLLCFRNEDSLLRPYFSS